VEESPAVGDATDETDYFRFADNPEAEGFRRDDS
jgi:hypothetical protein